MTSGVGLFCQSEIRRPELARACFLDTFLDTTLSLRHDWTITMGQPRGPKPQNRYVGTPLQGRPDPPAFLDDEASEHFRELAGMMSEAGCLSLLDTDALTLFCSHWSRWRKAEAILADECDVITAKNGYRQANPWYNVSQEAMKGMHLYIKEFGLSPLARSKMNLPEPDETEGKWSEFD
jgi:P27 family predicted phage terminase small subunit